MFTDRESFCSDIRFMSKIFHRLMTKLSCELIESLNRHPPIPLLNAVPVQLGRSRETLVTDKRCSRVQLELVADYYKQEVSIEHKGTLPSRVAGEILTDGNKVTIGNGSFFSLTEELFKYHVFFRTCSSSGSNDITVSKNPLDSTNIGSPQPEVDEPAPKKSKLEDFFIKDPTSSTPTNRPISASQRIVDGSLVLYKTPLLYDKVAAFDLDGTLIATKSGNVFPKDTSDWRPLYPSVKCKLQELHRKDEFDIVIFSNQMGASRGKPLPDIESILSYFQVPANVLFATSNDIYRKPAPGMWEYFLEHIVGGRPLDLADSLYCGDAAGRDKNPLTGKKDFSESDLKFAHNISLTFYTPEELFLGHQLVLGFGPSFIPYEFKEELKKTDLLHPRDAVLFRERQELILLVGCQASGKSSFYRQHLADRGYVHVSQDVLKTREKCLVITEQLLKNGKSVVIDNTNPDVASRKGFVQICQKLVVPVRAFWMSTSMEHCRHNNVFRKLTECSSAHAGVDERVMNIYKHKFETPKLEEGFEEIVKVNLRPSFSSKREEELYFKFLL